MEGGDWSLSASVVVVASNRCNCTDYHLASVSMTHIAQVTEPLSFPSEFFNFNRKSERPEIDHTVHSHTELHNGS